jgi:predicted ATPase/class 3 adenylate cyclase
MAQPADATVTFLFTDVEGSTRLLQDVGPRYADYLDAHRGLLRAAFETHGGREVDTQGDSFFVVFPTPGAAVRASVDAQQALAGYPWPDGRAVRVRIGIHTGEATRVADGFVGIDVHRAARIGNAAHGGQIVLSETAAAFVRDTLPDGASLHDLGEHRLKDFGRPQRLFQLDVTGLHHDFPPLRTMSPAGHPPAPLGTFVGRAGETRAVTAMLEAGHVRLVTLTGPGGIGKTRLALEVASRVEGHFEHGVAVVMLAAIGDPSLVVPAIRDGLGVHEDPDADALETVAAYLSGRHILLVLDNFEHLIGAAPAVATLLARAERLKVLVTSREVLRVSGEQEFEVPPLEVDVEAVELFVDRARAASHDFVLTDENAPVIAEICRRLDGLPLAIELAAARVRLLPVETILGRLENRLALLTGGARDLPARQRSLRSTIAWSYDLLDDPDRLLFERLGVFRGGWTLDAAEAVCQGDGVVDVLEGLASLVDKSFVRRHSVVGGEPRFTMLETLREFALLQLEARGGGDPVRARHAEYFRGLAAEAGPRLRTGEQSRWLERLTADADNVRAATRWFLERGEASAVARTGWDLWPFWWVGGRINEGAGWMEEVVATGGPLTEEADALATAVLGILAFGANDFERALPHLKRAEEACRRVGDRQGQALALAMQGVIIGVGGDRAAGEAALAESLSLFTGAGDAWGMAFARYCLSRVLLVQDRHREALATLELAVAGVREVGEKVLLGLTLLNLGWAQLGVADFAAAVSSLRESLDLVAPLRTNDAARVLEALAAVALSAEEPAVGAVFFGAAEGVRRSLGASVWVPDRASHDHTDKALREALPPEEYESRFAEGTSVTIEEAAELAARLSQAASSS